MIESTLKNGDVRMGNFAAGITLSLITLLSWGSWPTVRMYCKAEGPVFAMLYLCGQFLTAVTFILILQPAALTEGLYQASSDAKIVCIMLGGLFVAFGDFLCSTACLKVPYAIAFPVFTGTTMAGGTTLTYIVTHACSIDNGDPTTGKRFSEAESAALLFFGVFMALMAVFSLAMADVLSLKNKKPSDAIGESDLESVANPMLTVLPIESGSENIDHCSDTRNNSSSEVSPKLNNASTPAKFLSQIDPWVVICFMAGCLASSWPPLANFGGSGVDGMKNERSRLFVFVCGELLTIPLLLVVYGHVIVVYDTSPASATGLTHMQSLNERAGDSMETSGKLMPSAYEMVASTSLSSDGTDSPCSDNSCRSIHLASLTHNPLISSISEVDASSLSQTNAITRNPEFEKTTSPNIEIIKPPRNAAVPVTTYLLTLYHLPRKDKLLGVLAGSLVGFGYSLLFLASEMIQPSVAFGIAACEPLASILIAVGVSGVCKGETWGMQFGIGLAVALFILAISLMTISDL